MLGEAGRDVARKAELDAFRIEVRNKLDHVEEAGLGQ